MRYLLSAIFSFFLVASISAQDLYDESVMRDVYLEFQQANWWQQLESNYGTGVEIKGDMTVDGVTYPDVGVRFKGNTSYTRPTTQKKSFNISLNSFVPGQDLMGYSTLNFNNAFMDPTFMREVLFSKVCRDYTSAAKGNFVHLIINNENWGVYANIQQLNRDFLEEWYATDTGDRFKVPSAMRNPGKASLNWLGTNSTSYFQWYELKSADPAGYDRLVDLCNTLNNTPSGPGYLDAIESILNLDRALWTLALENAFMDSDGYVHKGSDYALYRDDIHGRWNFLQRDANEAFGSFGWNSWGTNGAVNLHPNYDITNTDLPVMNLLLNIPEVWERYLAHFQTILDEWIVSAKVTPIVDTWDNLIRAEVQADTKKIYSFNDYLTNLYDDVNQGQIVFKGLQQFVLDRRTYLQSLPEFNRPRPQLGQLGHSPLMPEGGETVTVTVQASAPVGTSLDKVDLHFRNLGAFLVAPMFDDGQNGDGSPNDGTWGARLPGFPIGTHVEYYISASLDVASGGAWSFLPRTAEFSPPSWLTQSGSSASPCVNEFLAINSTIVSDENGDFDDWIEILNRDTIAVDLGGLFLSDDFTNLTKWSIPSGTSIPSGGTALIWADEDGSQGPLHANFKLSGSGEEIFLTATDGVTILDAVAFGQQADDISTGRLLDGDSQWVTFSSPTPNASNEQSCGYRAYDQLDPLAHGLKLRGSGSPAYGGSIDILLSGAAAGNTMTLYVSLSPSYLEEITSAGVVLINPFQLVFQRQLSADLNGEASLTAPLNNPALIGRSFYAQGHLPSSVLGEMVSNALEVTICP